MRIIVLIAKLFESSMSKTNMQYFSQIILHLHPNSVPTLNADETSNSYFMTENDLHLSNCWQISTKFWGSFATKVCHKSLPKNVCQKSLPQKFATEVCHRNLTEVGKNPLSKLLRLVTRAHLRQVCRQYQAARKGCWSQSGARCMCILIAGLCAWERSAALLAKIRNINN